MAATMIVFLVTTLLCSVTVYVSCSEQCDQCANIAASHRIACGDDSMTRRGCSLRGCCWSSDGGPSCYMANIAAVKAIGYRRNDYFGELYPISNALDGFDPTGLDPSNCALIDNTNHQYAEFTITFDTFHVISGVNLHGADGTLNDLAITVDYDLVGTNNGISCGIISADEQSDEVHAKCSSPIIGQRIRIKSRSKTGPLRVCHVYVSGVKYQPQCALIDEKYKMQCLDSSASYEQCAAAGCCYDEAESPSCYLANVAYGKHVTKTPANKKIAIFTDGHIHDREEFYNTQSISIDLKRTYSIKKVIFHTYNSAHPATLELYVTKDGVYSESAVCKTTTLGNSVDTFPMQCDSPKNGKFIGFKNIGHWDCLLYEIIVLGQTVESSEFGPSSLQKWGKLDNNNKAIVIPDQSAGWTSAVGTVTGWKVSAGSTEAVHLSFWRPAEHGHFTYVGGTDFTPPSRGIHEIKLQEHQTFEIREGDVIGLQWNNGAVVRYKNNEDCGSEGVKHLIHVNPSPVHSKEQPVYFSEKNKCGSYQVVAMVDP